MPYIQIADFRSGLDVRRPSLAAPAGTLQKLKNAHLTPGGDIEKRYAFHPFHDCGPNTFGVAGYGTDIYVFRQAGTPALASVAPLSLPVAHAIVGASPTLTVKVLDLPMPAGKTAQSLKDWDLFDGKIYSIVQATDGTLHHFYGTTYVADVHKMYDPPPHNIKTYKGKIYGITQDKLVFSAIDNPLKWDPAPPPAGTTNTDIGQGFIVLSSMIGTTDYLTGLEVYYDQLAIASRYSTQIWEVDADPKNNNLRQTLRGAGTVAANTMFQYGSGDVLYLHDSGIRSLRAKDSSNAASVSDIGSPVDPTIQHIIRTRPDDPYVRTAFSLIEPNTGRFWMCFRDRIFILSYYPGPKVTAWSEYVPEFQIDGGTTARGQIILRSGQNLYVYGGLDGITYDDCEVEVETPYLSVDKPATFKMFTAVDFVAWGVWHTKSSFAPNTPTAWDDVCTTTEPTLGGEGSVALQGMGTHVAFSIKNKAPGAAMLSSAILHYTTNGKSD